MLEALDTSGTHSYSAYQEWLRRNQQFWTYRLSDLLQRAFGDNNHDAHPGLHFLQLQSASIDRESLDKLLVDGLPDYPPADSPLGRLVTQYLWSRLDLALFMIASLAEIHEGYADILKMVNPENQPFAATGLVAQLIGENADRKACERSLLAGPATTSGAIVVVGEGPIYTRFVKVSKHLWAALTGIEVWPDDCPLCEETPVSWGLDAWMCEPASVRAISLIRNKTDLVIQIRNADSDVALNRALSLVGKAGILGRAFKVSQKITLTTLRNIYLHCCLRDCVPVLKLEPLSQGPEAVFDLGDLPPITTVVTATEQDQVQYGNRPLVNVSTGRLRGRDYQHIWAMAIPDQKSHAPSLAARFPVEPNIARNIALDLAHLDVTDFNQIAGQIRSRAGALSAAGVSLIKPCVGWDDLILTHEHKQQLRESINRLENQSVVLNQWNFLKNRRGASGVRLLLAGPPGTGKTLSGEVLAYQLGVDLMIVDISRVVSKWIGETEKNLEKIFYAAEQSKAALLFDEADALFGKRTEVNDASDRNANLETAYLLTRLESFEGLVVMSTNMRNNIDPAFLRRLDYIIDFNEPNRQERKAIWECHMPKQAPLDADVDFAEIATMFPVVGGIIRNAAVSAAYLAAAERRSISKMDIVTALRREYDKQGKAFPILNTANQGQSF